MTRSILARGGVQCKRRREDIDDGDAGGGGRGDTSRRKRGVVFKEVEEEVVGTADFDVVRFFIFSAVAFIFVPTLRCPPNFSFFPHQH